MPRHRRYALSFWKQQIKLQGCRCMCIGCSNIFQDTHRNRQTYGGTGQYTDSRDTYKQTGGQSTQEADRQMDKKTDRQTNKQTDTDQKSRQTDNMTDI